MNPLNPLAIYALLTAITCFLLSLFTFLYRKTKFHRIWILFNLSIAGWAFFLFLATLSPDSSNAYFFWKISHSIGIYVSVLFFHAVCIYCDLRPWKLIEIAYGYGILWAILNFGDNGHYIYSDTKQLFGSLYYLQTKNLNFLVGISFWILLAVLGNYYLYDYSQKNKNQAGRQAKLWMFITIFGYIGGCSSFLPMLGVNIYPHAMIFLPTYALLLSYAIFKYQFFNFRVVLEKSIVYSSLIASVSIAYLAIVLTTEKALQSFLGYKSMSISLSAAFMIGILVIPLRNRIQFLLDRSLFKGTQPEIAAENELLRQEVTKSEKHKAVAALASGIAHEVRNPLTALKAFHEHFPEKKNDPEFLEKFTRIAGKEISRIEGLIQQLLDFAKPSPPSFQETDINQLVKDTLELLASKLKSNNIKILCTLDPNPCPLNVDSNQIKQALLNILLNAVDAMQTGGSLTVTSRIKGIKDYRNKDHISNPLILKSSTPIFEISIQDTGSGIAPEDLRHIFEPFFSKKASGTGLGLAITQSIIQEHNGKLKVTSTINEGTTFTIELPITKYY